MAGGIRELRLLFCTGRRFCPSTPWCDLPPPPVSRQPANLPRLKERFEIETTRRAPVPKLVAMGGAERSVSEAAAGGESHVLYSPRSDVSVSVSRQSPAPFSSSESGKSSIDLLLEAVSRPALPATSALPLQPSSTDALRRCILTTARDSFINVEHAHNFSQALDKILEYCTNPPDASAATAEPVLLFDAVFSTAVRVCLSSTDPRTFVSISILLSGATRLAQSTTAFVHRYTDRVALMLPRMEAEDAALVMHRIIAYVDTTHQLLPSSIASTLASTAVLSVAARPTCPLHHATYIAYAAVRLGGRAFGPHELEGIVAILGDVRTLVAAEKFTHTNLEHHQMEQECVDAFEKLCLVRRSDASGTLPAEEAERLLAETLDIRAVNCEEPRAQLLPTLAQRIDLSELDGLHWNRGLLATTLSISLVQYLHEQCFHENFSVRMKGNLGVLQCQSRAEVNGLKLFFQQTLSSICRFLCKKAPCPDVHRPVVDSLIHLHADVSPSSSVIARVLSSAAATTNSCKSSIRKLLSTLSANIDLAYDMAKCGVDTPAVLRHCHRVSTTEAFQHWDANKLCQAISSLVALAPRHVAELRVLVTSLRARFELSTHRSALGLKFLSVRSALVCLHALAAWRLLLQHNYIYVNNDSVDFLPAERTIGALESVIASLLQHLQFYLPLHDCYFEIVGEILLYLRLSPLVTIVSTECAPILSRIAHWQSVTCDLAAIGGIAMATNPLRQLLSLTSGDSSVSVGHWTFDSLLVPALRCSDTIVFPWICGERVLLLSPYRCDSLFRRHKLHADALALAKGVALSTSLHLTDIPHDSSTKIQICPISSRQWNDVMLFPEQKQSSEANSITVSSKLWSILRSLFDSAAISFSDTKDNLLSCPGEGA